MLKAFFRDSLASLKSPNTVTVFSAETILFWRVYHCCLTVNVKLHHHAASLSLATDHHQSHHCCKRVLIEGNMLEKSLVTSWIAITEFNCILRALRYFLLHHMKEKEKYFNVSYFRYFISIVLGSFIEVYIPIPSSCSLYIKLFYLLCCWILLMENKFFERECHVLFMSSHDSK